MILLQVGVLLLTCLSGLVHSEEQPLVLKIPDIQVKALRSKESCVTCTRDKAPIPTLCQPNPQEANCTQVPGAFHERFQKIDQEALKQEDEFYEKFRKVNRESYDRHSRTLQGDALQSAIYGDIQKLVDAFFAAKKMDRFRDVVRATARHFRLTLEGAQGLGPEEKKVLLAMIAPCEKEVLIDPIIGRGVDKQVPGQFNATSWNKYPTSAKTYLHQIGSLYERGTRLTPIAQTSSCFITATSKMIDLCQEVTPECVYVFAHEIAHRVNSCNFMESSRRFLVQSRNQIQSEGDGYDRDRLAAARVHQESARRLYETTVGLTSCLDTLSSPKSGTINSCLPPDDGPWRPDPLLRSRCEYGTVPAQASQWSEAESDLWAASVLATYFEKSAMSQRERHSAMSRVNWFFCEEHATLAARKGERDWRVHFDRAGLDEKPRHLVEVKSNVSPSPTCRDLPLDTTLAGQSWYDHQDWSVRFNRNLLRNHDLRRALGCEPSAEVPTTCSPTDSTVRHYVPKN